MWELSTETIRIETAVVRYGVVSIFATVFLVAVHGAYPKGSIDVVCSWLFRSWLGVVRTEGDRVGRQRIFLTGVSEIAIDATGTACVLYSQVGKNRKTYLATYGPTVIAIPPLELLPDNPVITCLL